MFACASEANVENKKQIDKSETFFIFGIIYDRILLFCMFCLCKLLQKNILIAIKGGEMKSHRKLIFSNMRSKSIEMLKIIALSIGLFSTIGLNAQTVFPASPANWLYPNGNMQATRWLRYPSVVSQSLDSFNLKWSSGAIAGDVQPLIGNIINNGKVFDDFPFAPNEISAVIGNDIIVIDGSGKSFIKKKPDDIKLLKNVSVLIDTLNTGFDDLHVNPVVMGIETIESNSEDSLAFAYLAGFNNSLNNTVYLKRMAIDMRAYAPNIYAGVKPVYARKNGDSLYIYATINSSNPIVANGVYEPNQTPFIRGLTQFNASTKLPNYPSYDIADIVSNRLNFGPEISLQQPSISQFGSKGGILLPTYPTTSMQVTIKNENTFETNSEESYSLGFNIGVNPADQLYNPFSMTQIATGTRPLTRSYFVKLRNGNNAEDDFVLVSEEYKGIDGSVGQSKLHLFAKDGSPITLPNDIDFPPFKGNNNHLWSVAVGNVDGNAPNNSNFYPNNQGNEIIVTQSTKDFAFPKSKLFVLKYNTNRLDKPTPPNTILFPFDTICTSQVNGWVAAINDLDRSGDGKDEIVVVDGSTLRVLRMRNYSDDRFTYGYVFDTVYTKEFNKESISAAMIADMDGDGRNDIIVTTYKATYVIGIPLQNTLKVLSPRIAPAKVDYCLGDTVDLVWKNVLTSTSKVDIYFAEYVQITTPVNMLVPSGTVTKIRSDLDNNLDTLINKIVVDTTLLGKFGKFIVASQDNPTQMFDTTAMLSFQTLLPQLDSLPLGKLQVGKLLTLSGTTACIDSLKLEYKSDSVWLVIAESIVNSSGRFMLSGDVPCLNIFNCDTMDVDSTITTRIKAFKSGFSQNSSTFRFGVIPADFPIKIDSGLSASPGRVIRWNISDIKYSCDTVGFYFSLDGTNYGRIEQIRATKEYYEWNVPESLPDTILFRVCCENSCVRTDTILTGTKAKYIQIVAPNPFSPVNEQVEFIYTVPEDIAVSIRIIDENNRIVAEPILNQIRSRGIVYTDRWDGTLSNGSLAANGHYYLRLELANGKIEIYSLFVRK